MDQETLRLELEDGYPDKILPFLYLGSTDLTASVVHELKLSHVVTTHPTNCYPKLHFLSVTDPFDAQTFTFIESARESNGRVLIQGPVAIVLAYLMQKQLWTLRQSYQHISAIRPIPCLLETHFEKLQALDVSLHGRVSLATQEDGDEAPDETSVDRASTTTNLSSLPENKDELRRKSCVIS